MATLFCKFTFHEVSRQADSQLDCERSSQFIIWRNIFTLPFVFNPESVSISSTEGRFGTIRTGKNIWRTFSRSFENTYVDVYPDTDAIFLPELKIELNRTGHSPDDMSE